MQTRTPGHVTIYDDGVVVYLGIVKEDAMIEMEISTTAAVKLASELLERVNAIKGTLTIPVKKEIGQ